MCAKVKYGIWNVKQPDMGAVNALVGAGYAPLSAMVLACRGIENGDQAKKYLDCNAPPSRPVSDDGYGSRRRAGGAGY